MPESQEGVNLDIGSRDIPLIAERLRNDLAPKGRIICVDKRGGWLLNSKKHYLKKTYDFLVSKGQSLPLRKDSVDFVFARDLFGAHGNVAITPENDFVIEDVGENMAQEWFRVCKPGAKIVIEEISTPFPEDELRKEFENAGFRTLELNKGLDTALIYKDKIRHVLFYPDDGSYSLVMEKPLTL